MDKKYTVELIDLQFSDKQKHKVTAFTEDGADVLVDGFNDLQRRVLKLEEALKVYEKA